MNSRRWADKQFGPAGLADQRRGRRLAAGLLTLFLAAALSATAFDGRRAMNDLYAQCNLGPRIPGAPAHEAGKQWIAGRLREAGLKVWPQTFQARLALTGSVVNACNLWGLPAEDGPSSPALILSAHWDTRPWADKDPSGGNPPMLGANDGASGVAVALEIYRGLQNTPLKNHLVLAFWDVEDGGVDSQPDSWGLGSRYAAAHRVKWMNRIRLGINLDMVAGEDLQLRPETYSVQAAPWAVEELWSLGRSLAPAVFVSAPPQTVIDDHLPWIRQGVPFINVVGLPYRYWHTAGDTPEHCSPEKMEAVGNAVYNFLLGEPWKRPRAGVSVK